MFRPGTSPDEYGPAAARSIARLIDTAREADAMLWSTAGYHGTLAGVTKNALDFLEFLADEEKSYLQDKVIGLIATSGGTMAGANAVNNMVQVVHALRGTVAPLMVPIPQARRNVDARSGEIDSKWDKRLHKLGVLVVEMARALQPEAQQDEPALDRQGA
jgi:FMN reductase